MLIACIAIIAIGCKKDEINIAAKISDKTEVTYEFTTIGTKAQVTYTSVDENKTVVKDDIITKLKVGGLYYTYDATDHVKAGNSVQLKLVISKPDQVGYAIAIHYVKDLGNGSTVGRSVSIDSKKTTDSSGQITITADHIFTSEDFK